MNELLDAALERAGGEDGGKAELARVLGLPTSRIAEMFRRDPSQGKQRMLKYGEARTLIMRYFPEMAGETVSADRLAPILAVCLRHAPKAGWTETEVQRLAKAVEYGLGLLANGHATETSADAFAVAGQAALHRLREEPLPA